MITHRSSRIKLWAYYTYQHVLWFLYGDKFHRLHIMFSALQWHVHTRLVAIQSASNGAEELLKGILMSD